MKKRHSGSLTVDIIFPLLGEFIVVAPRKERELQWDEKRENSQGAQRQTWLQTLQTRLFPFYVSEVLIGSFSGGAC